MSASTRGSHLWLWPGEYRERRAPTLPDRPGLVCQSCPKNNHARCFLPHSGLLSSCDKGEQPHPGARSNYRINVLPLRPGEHYAPRRGLSQACGGNGFGLRRGAWRVGRGHDATWHRVVGAEPIFRAYLRGMLCYIFIGPRFGALACWRIGARQLSG